MSLAVESQPLLSETEEGETPVVALVLPPGVRMTISPENFETLCEYNRDLRLERTAQGELIAMSPVGSEGSWLEMAIGTRLFMWSEQDGTGRVFGASVGLTFPNSAVLSPDASWINEERWNRLTKEQKKRFAPIVPDFVIEICSPSDSRQATQAKMVEYIEQGVRLGWLIDPRKMDVEVEIYRLGRPVEILIKPQSLSGEDVLPGFVLDLNAILAKA